MTVDLDCGPRLWTSTVDLDLDFDFDRVGVDADQTYADVAVTWRAELESTNNFDLEGNLRHFFSLRPRRTCPTAPHLAAPQLASQAQTAFVDSASLRLVLRARTSSADWFAHRDLRRLRGSLVTLDAVLPRLLLLPISCPPAASLTLTRPRFEGLSMLLPRPAATLPGLFWTSSGRLAQTCPA